MVALLPLHLHLHLHLHHHHITFLSSPPPLPVRNPPANNSLCLTPSSSSSRFMKFLYQIPFPAEIRRKTRIACIGKTQHNSSKDKEEEEEEEEEEHSKVVIREKSVSVVLLAGGKGKRMGASMPKQYLPLLGQPIALYSFYTFSCMIEVKEIVVVCDPSYKDIFEDNHKKIHVDLKFALPGKERQDSVFSGLQEIDPSSELICVHDSARPLVSSGDIKKVLIDGWMNGAAVLGVPVKATIKEANNESFVVRTLDRKTLWEMQTPQVMKPELLRKGFELVNGKGLEVTDDVSIVEHLKHPVYITEGSYTNIKVTTPDDMLLAERILSTNIT